LPKTIDYVATKEWVQLPKNQISSACSEIKMPGQCRKAVLDSFKTSDILSINLKSKSAFEGLKPFSSFHNSLCTVALNFWAHSLFGNAGIANDPKPSAKAFVATQDSSSVFFWECCLCKNIVCENGAS